jgi:hypothetical protein
MPRLVVLRDGDLSLAGELINCGAAGVLALIDVSAETLQTVIPVFFYELMKGDGRVGPAIAAARTLARERVDQFRLAMFTGLKDGWLWYQEGFSPLDPTPYFAFLRRKRELTIVCGQALMDPLFGSVQRVVDRLATFCTPWRSVDSRAPGLGECLQIISMGISRDAAVNELRKALQSCLLQAHYGDDVSPKGALLDPVFEKLLQAEGSVYRMLADLDAPLYIDTNPIPVVYRLLRAAGKDPALVEVPWRIARRSDYEEPEPVEKDRQAVLQLYGSIINPDSLILGDDDHMDHLTACSAYRLIPPAIQSRAILSTLVFMGFSLRDPGYRYFQPLFPTAASGFHQILQVAGIEGASHTLIPRLNVNRLELYRGECEDILRELHRHLPPKTTSTDVWM